MASLQIPELKAKLGLFYGYTGLNLHRLAGLLGRADQTVSGWVNGTDTSDPEMVPEHGRTRLAALLVEAVSGRIDLEQARNYWLGSLAAFHAVLSHEAPVVDSFDRAVEGAKRASILTYVPADVPRERGVNFSPRATASATLSARVGDRFSFNAQGPAGAQLILIVESTIGRHLGAPSPEFGDKLDGYGRLRLPAQPHNFSFEEPRGLHRFLGFVVMAHAPLSIAACAGRLAPLTEKDLDRFALELGDQALVQSWSLDIVSVRLGDD